MKILKANRIAPDGSPRSVASHLGLYCLHMSRLNELKDNLIKNLNPSFFSNHHILLSNLVILVILEYHAFIPLVFTHTKLTHFK